MTHEAQHNQNTALAPRLLEMRNIGKTFDGTRALDGVSFEVRAGEIHALVGENGAGKSTLMKVLGGVHPYPDYDGGIFVDGNHTRFSAVRDAEKAGIAIIYQELSLVPGMSVAENIFLGREPSQFGFIRRDLLYSSAAKLLDRLHFNIDPRTPAAELGIGHQQMVEIAKALSQDARILVLDEPTAALTDAEVNNLMAILGRLRSEGTGIIYISHKLGEVFRLSDRITVLRDGRTIASEETRNLTESAVISMMVGRSIDQVFPVSSHELKHTILEVENIRVVDSADQRRTLVNNVSFSLRSGEVLGLAGLIGSGRSDLLMAIFGAHEKRAMGRIRIDGEPVSITAPSDAIGFGISLVTEDRVRFGLIAQQSIMSNITLAALRLLFGRVFTHPEKERLAAQTAAVDLRIKAVSLDALPGTLSGGNQQKVVVANSLLTKPKVLLLDEPTRGIDVGSRQEIYSLINRLAGEGMGIVVVSSDLNEVLGLADRILVLRDGAVVGEFAREDATPERIMSYATGTGVMQ